MNERPLNTEAIALKALAADAELGSTPPTGSVGANAMLNVAKMVQDYVDSYDRWVAMQIRRDENKRIEEAEEIVNGSIGTHPEKRMVWQMWTDLALYDFDYRDMGTRIAEQQVRLRLEILASTLLVRWINERFYAEDVMKQRDIDMQGRDELLDRLCKEGA